jgi:histone-lysine N-methyltransferase SETD3
MVPWADMLNHFRPRETSWTFDNSQQGFTMTSLKELSRGQQIMDSYGKKCNSKFLMHYGFAIEKNREEDGKCMNEMPLVFTLEVSLLFSLYCTQSI